MVVWLARSLRKHFQSASPYTERTVAIITPYKAQKRLIQTLLSTTSSGGSGDKEEHGGSNGSSAFEVNTVDGFQGREKDCVVFSCVRDGLKGGIGFLADERRLNVAVTRARGMLAIVGHAEGIAARNDTWRALVGSVRARGRLLDVETAAP